MIKIAVLGAFDRYNYGDLLFPHVVENEIKNRNVTVELDYVSLFARNMSAYGGKNTISLREFRNNYDKYDGIIVAGGDVVGANWCDTLYYMLDNNFIALSFRVIKKIFGEDVVSKLIANTIGSGCTFPWIPQYGLNSKKTLYSSVGGSGISLLTKPLKTKLMHDLEYSTYISVRDNKTKGELSTLNNNVLIAPDSAILISQYFRKSILSPIISGSYIVFQICQRLSKGHEAQIAEQLMIISKNTGMKVVLLPIGTAQGHSDQIPLRKIKNILGTKSIIFEDQVIENVMNVIANSQIFIGTSLHGCITAMSFKRNFIALVRGVPKLETYVTTWCNKGINICYDYESISKKFNELSTHVPSTQQLDNMIIKSKENFGKMVSILVSLKDK